ncbi:MAG: hypothetical protein ACREQN_00520 [Candidatus Binataceae bacterium]
MNVKLRCWCKQGRHDSLIAQPTTQLSKDAGGTRHKPPLFVDDVAFEQARDLTCTNHPGLGAKPRMALDGFQLDNGSLRPMWFSLKPSGSAIRDRPLRISLRVSCLRFVGSREEPLLFPDLPSGLATKCRV